MNKKGQASWSAIFFVGVLALAALSFCRAASAAGPATSNDAPLTPPVVAQNFGWRNTDTLTATKPVARPVLVSGTAGVLWLAEPLEVEVDGQKRPAFKLLQHEADKRGPDNQDLWSLAQEPGKSPVIFGSPVQLIAGADGLDGVYVVMESGVFIRATLTGVEEMTSLPEGQKVLGAAGSDRGIFVLARGPVVPAPESAESAETAPATGPSGEYWNVLQYTGGQWVPTVLGRVGDADVPGAEARVLLAEQGGQVAVFWHSPTGAGTLFVRVMSGDGTWSAPTRVDVGEEMTRLLGVTIAPQSFVLWPVKTGDQIEIHGRVFHWGGSATRQATLTAPVPAGADAANSAAPAEISNWPMTAMKLGAVAPGMDAQRDVGVARTGNSLMVIMAGGTGKEDEFTSLLFDTSGHALPGGLMKIAPAMGTDTFVTENVLLAVTLGLVLMSFWHWRKRPEPVRLPKEMKIPLLRKRIMAGVIDFGLPLIGVIFYLGLWRDWKWWGLLEKWSQAMLDVSLWNTMPELLWAIGLYVGHVMAGELIFGRSLGKAIMGMRVVGVDGKKAEPVGIVLRNLMRVPELMTGILLLCVLINDQKQRLGDWVGRTVVVEAGDGEEGEVEGNAS